MMQQNKFPRVKRSLVKGLTLQTDNFTCLRLEGYAPPSFSVITTVLNAADKFFRNMIGKRHKFYAWLKPEGYGVI